jgi:hypothetical protein
VESEGHPFYLWVNTSDNTPLALRPTGWLLLTALDGIDRVADFAPVVDGLTVKGI